MEFDPMYTGHGCSKRGYPEITTFYHPYAAGKFLFFSSSECGSESASSTSVPTVEYLGYP